MDVEGFYQRVKECAKRTIPPKTIQEIAESAGMSRGSYNSYRTCGNLPRADEAYIMARELNTTVEYLVTGHTRPGDVIPPRLAPIIKDLTFLPDSQLATVAHMVSGLADSIRSQRAGTIAM